MIVIHRKDIFFIVLFFVSFTQIYPVLEADSYVMIYGLVNSLQ